MQQKQREDLKERTLTLCKIADEKWFNNGYKHSYKGKNNTFPLNSIDCALEKWAAAYCIQVVESTIRRWRAGGGGGLWWRAFCYVLRQQSNARRIKGLLRWGHPPFNAGWESTGILYCLLNVFWRVKIIPATVSSVSDCLKRRSKLQSSVGNSLKGSVLFVVLCCNS